MKAKAFVVLMVTLSLVMTLFSAIPVSAPADKRIVIGVICDKKSVVGKNTWRGAQMARDEVNAWNGEKGVNVNGTYRKIRLFYIEEHAYPTVRPDLGTAELTGALPFVDFLIGGFTDECAGPMREAAMDYAAVHGKPIWLIVGATIDRLIDCGNAYLGSPYPCDMCVRCNYARYKYMFRATFNQTTFWMSLAAFLREYLLGLLPETGLPYNTPGKLACMFEDPVPTFLVMEDRVWADAMLAVLLGSSYVPTSPYPTPPNPGALLGNHCVIVGFARPAWDANAFGPILNAIDASGAKLVIHGFSGKAGASFSLQFGPRQMDAVLVGINVESQRQSFWTISGGLCEYETFLSYTGTPVVPGTTNKFWDRYYERYVEHPEYTAFGAYDALMSLAETVEAVNTLDSDVLIPTLEQTERDSLVGRFKFTGPHPGAGYQYDNGPETTDDDGDGVLDINSLNPTKTGGLHEVYSDSIGPTWPEPHYVRLLAVQWQAGRQEVVWPRDQNYSRRYQIPPWMWTTATGDSIADTDWAGNGPIVLPGPIVISPYLFPNGIVDIVDLDATAWCWQQAPPWFALEADINGDGVVDIDDTEAIGKDWTKAVA